MYFAIVEPDAFEYSVTNDLDEAIEAGLRGAHVERTLPPPKDCGCLRCREWDDLFHPHRDEG